jgi:hypothetical protein
MLRVAQLGRRGGTALGWHAPRGGGALGLSSVARWRPATGGGGGAGLATRSIHGLARLGARTARSSLRARPAPLLLGLRRGLSAAAPPVAANLKKESGGMWAGVVKAAGWIRWGLGWLLYPFHKAAGKVWEVIAPVRQAIAFVFNRFPILKVIPVLGVIGTSLNMIFLAVQKMQHSFTDILRTVSYYLTQMVVFLVVGLAMMLVAARHRLSMSSVHHKTYRIVESLPIIQQKLGKPITKLQDKRIEMRTGGHYKLKIPSSAVVDVLEKATGRDIDEDGDVGVKGSSNKQTLPATEDAPKPPGAVASLRNKLAALWARTKLPSVKYKKQRAHMVFPVIGPHKEQAMVCVECVKRPGSLISNPLGYYDWKLISVDFADNTYFIQRGDEERYNRPLMTRLRLPMVEWMMSSAAIEEEEEIEDDAERLRAQQARLSSD